MTFRETERDQKINAALIGIMVTNAGKTRTNEKAIDIR